MHQFNFDSIHSLHLSQYISTHHPLESPPYPLPSKRALNTCNYILTLGFAGKIYSCTDCPHVFSMHGLICPCTHVLWKHSLHDKFCIWTILLCAHYYQGHFYTLLPLSYLDMAVLRILIIIIHWQVTPVRPPVICSANTRVLIITLQLLSSQW